MNKMLARHLAFFLRLIDFSLYSTFHLHCRSLSQNPGADLVFRMLKRVHSGCGSDDFLSFDQVLVVLAHHLFFPSVDMLKVLSFFWFCFLLCYCIIFGLSVGTGA